MESWRDGELHRRWQNDQTLSVEIFYSLVTSLNIAPLTYLAYEANMFWTISKTPRNKFCLGFHVKRCFMTWPYVQKILEKQTSNVLTNDVWSFYQSLNLVINVELFEIYSSPWPNDQKLLVKHLRFCFTSNVWPFGPVAKHCLKSRIP